MSPKILTGLNLGAPGVQFDEWYVLSNGYPVQAWLSVYSPSRGWDTFYGNMPGPYPGDPYGNPKIPPTGWITVVVCNDGGCTTNFSGGSGSLEYIQSNIAYYSPYIAPDEPPTGENSNCQYGAPSINGGNTRLNHLVVRLVCQL